MPRPTNTPLWTCPKCGVKLVGKNMSHSCGLATLDDWKAKMGPRARAFYDRFEQMIAACGEYHIGPAKTRISFLARVRFANITSLKESGMKCNFALPRPIRSKRIVKFDQILPDWCVHHLHVTELDELDDQVQRWIRRSYEIMGTQKRLLTE